MNTRQVAEDAIVLTHRCDLCHRYIEVLHLAGFVVSWSGKHATVAQAADAAYVCHRCRIDLLPVELRATAVQHFDELLQIRDRLGIPPEVTLHVFEGQGRQDVVKLRPFRLMLFAVQVRHWPDGSPIPCLRVPGTDEHPTYEFAFPMVAIGRENLLAALECRWSVTDPLSPATALEIAGWQRPDRLNDLHRLVDGLAILRDFPPMRAGRRTDTSKTIPPEVFAARIPQMYRDHVLQFGQHPTQADLAAAFYVSRSTIFRCIQRYREDGGAWPPETDY